MRQKSRWQPTATSRFLRSSDEARIFPSPMWTPRRYGLQAFVIEQCRVVGQAVPLYLAGGAGLAPCRSGNPTDLQRDDARTCHSTCRHFSRIARRRPGDS